jgi:hypothetical protein
MAQYVEKQLTDDELDFNLDEHIRRMLRLDAIKSVEVIPTENSFVIRHWFAFPYDLGEHEKILF